MEIITQDAQATQSLGEEIGNYLIFCVDGSCRSLAPKATLKRGTQLLGRPGSRHPLLEDTVCENYVATTRKKAAFVFALKGELGSGKTTFLQGFARCIGLPSRLVSPTFIIVREYALGLKFFRRFYHIDLYRMDSAVDLAGLGLTDIFADPTNIVAIEWVERLKKGLPQERLNINFSYEGETTRKIQINQDQKPIPNTLGHSGKPVS